MIGIIWVPLFLVLQQENNSKGFLLLWKMGKYEQNKKKRGSMHRKRDPPCLKLQCAGNKVITKSSTINNAHEYTDVARKIKASNGWERTMIRISYVTI